MSVDYQECLQEAQKMIHEAKTETRVNAIKKDLLEIDGLTKQVSVIETMLIDASIGEWKPILTKYANTVYEID